MSVHGIDLFTAALKPWADSYVLIGGSACDLLAESLGSEFRATKDLDVVVIADGASTEFAAALWKFVKDGGYRAWEDRRGTVRFYRFEKPTDQSYPFMIELFSRHPDFALNDESSEVAPLPFSEDVSSLSAIILDDDYYSLIREGARAAGSTRALDAVHLIPLKMKAHIDLNRRKAEGATINSADLKKHRKDVVRLLNFVPESERLILPTSIRNDAHVFLRSIDDPSFRTDQIAGGVEKTEVVRRLRTIYGLEGE